MKSKRPYYIALVVLFAIAATYQIRFSIDAIRELTAPTDESRRPLSAEQTSARINFVGPEAAEAGVKLGDRLLSVNGQPYVGSKSLNVPLERTPSGGQLTFGISREDGREETLTVTLRPLTTEPRGLGETLVGAILSLLMPIFCLLLGFWVAASRPRDLLAWLLLFLMLSFSVLLARTNISGWGEGLRQLGTIYFTFFFASWPLWMMLFGLYFPERLEYEKRWPWAKWLLIGPLVLTTLTDVILELGSVENYAAVPWVSDLLRPYGMVITIIRMSSIGLFFMFIGLKQGLATSPDARRRLKLVNVGTMISMTPMFLLVIRSLIVGAFNPFSGLPAWILVPSLLLVFLFPLTLAYVIVVHRAMDIRVALRQGMQYALARNGVRVMQIILSAVVIFVAASVVAQSSTNRPQKIIVVAIGVTVVFLLQGMAERVRRWTDRRFFREAYNSEQILSDLSENVRTMVETAPLLETVAQRISESLHVPQVALMLKGDGFYRPAHSLGYDAAPRVAFPEQTETVNQIRESKQPLFVYSDDADSWVHKTPGIEKDEREMLEELHTQLLLPLAVKENLHGFISLGPKQSEQPYSSTDLRLLQSVGTQTGLALENSRLTEAIATAIAQRERLNREVEIAREVQERLFPQNLPTISGLDYSGACRPALGVGGDYYDFLQLPGGIFGIAVGDVSGKGIAAALLMASLQASLRGQAMVGTNNLAELMSIVNRLVYDASAENRYATFFYAQYDPETRSLTYVNAGHNPPVILRKNGGGQEVVRLETGGAVVGLIPNFPYQQDTVTLQSGDLFIGFTDGISEAMNPADEEWGEESMLEAANALEGLNATEIISRLMGLADEFAAGAKQHDDMTLIVVRVL